MEKQIATIGLATASLVIVNPRAGTRRMAALVSTRPRTEKRVRRLRGMARG